MSKIKKMINLERIQNKDKIEKCRAESIELISSKHNLQPLEIIEVWLSRAKRGDWDNMVGLCQLTWLNGMLRAEAKAIIASYYDYHVIKKWIIGKQIENAPCKQRYLILVETQQDKYVMTPNVICETAPFTPDIKGTWGINPISAMLRRE